MVDMPMGMARLQARFMEMLPGKPLTRDQLLMLQQDNVVAPTCRDCTSSVSCRRRWNWWCRPICGDSSRAAARRRVLPAGTDRPAEPTCRCRRKADRSAGLARRAARCDKRRRCATLYHLPLSPFSRKVRLVLAEKRLPFDLRAGEGLGAAGGIPGAQPGRHRADAGRGQRPRDSRFRRDLRIPGRGLSRHPAARAARWRNGWRRAGWWPGSTASSPPRSTRNLLGEKFMKRMAGRGNPDAAAMRTGYLALRYHLEYLGWLAETRKWLAGSAISLADFRRGGASVVPGLHRRRGLDACRSRPGTGTRG